MASRLRHAQFSTILTDSMLGVKVKTTYSVKTEDEHRPRRPESRRGPLSCSLTLSPTVDPYCKNCLDSPVNPNVLLLFPHPRLNFSDLSGRRSTFGRQKLNFPRPKLILGVKNRIFRVPNQFWASKIEFSASQTNFGRQK